MKEISPSPSSRPSSRPTLRLPVGLAFFGFMLSGISEGSNGILLPSLTAFYRVDNVVIGLLFFVSSFGYFLAALGSGLLTQRLGLRRLLLFGAVAFVLGVFPFALKVPFLLLLPARFLLGLSIGILETGLNIYITSLPRSTLWLNYLHAFYGVGALFGPVATSFILALQWGWNSVYLLQSSLGLLLLLGFGLFFAPVSPQMPVEEEKSSTTGRMLSTMLKLPIVWSIALFLLVYVGVEVSLGNWSYSFLLKDRHEGPLVAGWIVSGYWLGLTLGRFLLQNLAERLGIGTKGLMSACVIAIGVGLLLIWLIPVEFVAIPVFGLIGLSLGPIYPLTVAIMPKLVPAYLGPSAIGLLVSISIIGLAVFPWIAGVLAQIFGNWTLLPYALALTVVMFVIWRALARQAGASLDL